MTEKMLKVRLQRGWFSKAHMKRFHTYADIVTARICCHPQTTENNSTKKIRKNIKRDTIQAGNSIIN